MVFINGLFWWVKGKKGFWKSYLGMRGRKWRGKVKRERENNFLWQGRHGNWLKFIYRVWCKSDEFRPWINSSESNVAKETCTHLEWNWSSKSKSWP